MLLYSLIVIVILAPPSLHGVSSQPISSAQTASFSQTASSLKNVYTAIGFFGFKNDRKASVTVSEIFNLSPRNLKAGKKHAIEDVAIQFSDTKADQHSSLGDVVATPPIDAVRHSVDAAEAAGATTALVDSLGGPKNDTTSNDAISTSSPSEYANGNSEAQDDRAGDGSTINGGTIAADDDNVSPRLVRRKCGCLRGPIPTDPQDGTEYGDGVCGCQERQKAMARSKLRTPVIVGAVVGGVVFFVVTGLMVFFCTGMRCCGNRAKDVEMEMAIIKRYHERTRVETLAIGPGDGR